MTMGRIIILKTVRIYPLLCYFLTLEVAVWRFVVLFRCRESQIGKFLSAISISLPLSALPIFRKKWWMGNGCRESGFPTTRRELASTVALSVRRRGTPFSAIRKPLRQLPFGILRQSAENRPFQRQKTTISSPFTIPLSTLFRTPAPLPCFFR